MKKGLITAICFSTAFLNHCIVAGAKPARDPELVKAQYQEVAAQLDAGGDLYVVANVDGIAEELVSTIDGIVQAAGTGVVSDATAKLPDFLRKNGFYAARCLGMSSVPRKDGRYDIKLFLSRDPAAAKLPLWRGVFGDTAPAKLRSIDFLPANTVLARVFNGRPPELWTLARRGVAELGRPESLKAFDASISNASARIGVSFDKLIASIGDEGFFSIQLSDESTTQIPLGLTDGASIPEPSVLIGMAVKDDTLAKAFENQFAKAMMPSVKTQVGAETINTVNIPLPLPIPFQISFASCSGFFLLGTTERAVTDAINALQKTNGLAQTAEFKAAFQGLPAENNGIAYIDKRFSKAVADLQAQLLSMTASSGRPSPGAALAETLRKMELQSSAVVFLNRENGLLAQATSSTGGREIVSAVALFPVGLVAGVAVPSFMKARQTSQKNACVNNQRILDAAKEQWALEANKQDGDQTEDAGVLKYLRKGLMPVCPAGGTYKLNPIGTPPECSLPEHSMSW